MPNMSGESAQVLILSDSHSWSGLHFLKDLERMPDQIWHAGDIGKLEVTDKLAEIAPLRAVYGNIDDAEIRRCFPEYDFFKYQGLRILMTHIGGKTGSYNRRVNELIKKYRPNIFICGHSHICKVERDRKNNLLYINPGAIGIQGFHKFRTCILLKISEGKPSALRVLEYPRNMTPG